MDIYTTQFYEKWFLQLKDENLSLRNNAAVILLLGGDKDTQERDLQKAEIIARDIHLEDMPI